VNNSTSAPASAAGPAGAGFLPIVYLLVLGFCFGVSFVLNKFATTNGVPFIPYVFWQTIGAALILGVAAAGLRQLPAVTGAHLRIYVVMALLNVAIPYVVLAYVADKLPASLLPIGLALVPEPGMAGWLALSLLATLSFSLRAVLVPLMRPPATPSLSLACGLLIAASAIMLVIMAATGQWWAFDGEFGMGHGMVLAAMVNNALLLVLIFEIIRIAGPVFFGGINYVSMLIGVVLGVVIFDESHTMWVWLAIALVLVGLYLVNRGKAR
jgi:drug/metabolite transporter (DMT)-like permease